MKDPSTVLWLDRWIANTERSSFSSRLAPQMDNFDEWRRLREAKYAADDLLRLCDPQRRARFAQHLLCALIFDREIFALPRDGEKPLVPPEQVRRLYCRFLRHNGTYKMALCPAGEDQVNWHRVVSYFSPALAPADQLSLLGYIGHHTDMPSLKSQSHGCMPTVVFAS